MSSSLALFIFIGRSVLGVHARTCALSVIRLSISSHVFQLRLNFVENIVLHLSVFAVTSARAVLQRLLAVGTVLGFIEALLQPLVQFLPNRHRLGLLTREGLLVLLNLTMQPLRHLLLLVVMHLHEALLELGRTENQTNFCTGLFIVLLLLLDNLLLMQPMRARLVEIFRCIVELKLLKSITLLLFIGQIVR